MSSLFFLLQHRSYVCPLLGYSRPSFLMGNQDFYGFVVNGIAVY